MSSCDFSTPGGHRPSPLLDGLPSYSQYDTHTILDPAVITTVEMQIDSLDRSLRGLSLAIHGKFWANLQKFLIRALPQTIPRSSSRKGNEPYDLPILPT